MPKSKGQGRSRSRSSSRSSSRGSKEKDKQISARTKKQIDSLPEHAQHIYMKTHASALEQYQNPEKRRGGKRQSPEEVAHNRSMGCCKKTVQEKRK